MKKVNLVEMPTLSPEIAAAVTFQQYAPQPPIEGVKVVKLRKFRGLEGAFTEVMRLDGGQVEGQEQPFEARQVSVSHAVAGRINAFHIHPKRPQEELWCVLQGELKVWIVDVRSGSPTEGARAAHLLSGEEPALLRIPAGVAHGYQAGASGALLLYAVSEAFCWEDPNEGRLPWDAFGTDIWEADRG